jgi:hypothetical protein
MTFWSKPPGSMARNCARNGPFDTTSAALPTSRIRRELRLALYQVQQHVPADLNQRVLDTVLGGLESAAKALSNMPEMPGP